MNKINMILPMGTFIVTSVVTRSLRLCRPLVRFVQLPFGWRHCFVLGVLTVLVAGCGRAPSTPLPETESVAVQTSISTVAAVSLPNQELLRQPGVTFACDSAEGVDFDCTTVDGLPKLTVAVDGSGFARWLLRVDIVEEGLTGDETLLIQARQQGDLLPNLYLVEQSGRRVAVPLRQYGFSADDSGRVQQIAVPLREIRDDNDEWPTFAAVNEVQLVFEWAAMAGDLEIMSLQFADRWQQTVPRTAQATTLAAGLVLPTGFRATAIADQAHAVTQLVFTPAASPWGATLWVSTQSGRIWRYIDLDADGVYDERLLYATGFDEVVGLLPDPVDGAVWVGGRGLLIRTLDSDGDGVADVRETRLSGLPWGRHQNNGMVWNPVTDPFTGEPAHHWIYFGLGSTEDLEVGGEWNAQVLRFPRDGQGAADLETVSRGNRNPYMVIWAPVPVDPAQPDGATAWQLFAAENGPDFNDAPDEVNHIRWLHDYGFPDQFGPVDTTTGAVDGEPYSGPVYPVAAHASASGLAYVTNPAWPPAYRTLYVSLFGQVFGEGVVGHTVERITLEPVASATDMTYRGIPSVFMANLDRPLPLTTAPDGGLVVGDYATGVIYRVDYVGMEE